jgi:hypothetical protein
MKQHEKDAQKLWARYLLGKTNEDDFWQKYEALLEQQERKKEGFISHATAPLPQILSTQVYHNSFWRLFVEAVLFNIVLTCTWFLFEFFLKVKGGSWQLLLLLVFYIIPWLALIRTYGYFSLHPHGLLIKRWGCSPNKFAWRQIKKVEFKQNRYVEIVTYGDTYAMGIAMSSKQRDELKTAIEYYINTPMPSRI